MSSPPLLIATASSIASSLVSFASAADLDVIAPLAPAVSSASHFSFEPADALPLSLPGQTPPNTSAAPEATLTTPPSDGTDSDALAKKLNNPISDLISIPFQFNYDEGFGAKNAGKVTLNIQPVIPFSITEDWNLILRTIVPVVYQGSTANGIDSDFGLGDTTQSFFFSPKDPLGGWILGFGPVFLWPTGTPQTVFGSGKWGVGPTGVALRQDGPWTIGILANQIWSYAGQDDRSEVNATFLQPFIVYTFPTATSITLNTESSYNWQSGEWSVPINLMGSQVLRLGHQPISVQFGGRYWAESPTGGPEWGLRLNITLLFPK